MKKSGRHLLTLILALCLTLALAGCGGNSSGITPAAPSSSGSASASSGSESSGSTNQTDSFLGDEVSTDFFDFSIDSAQVCSTYEDVSASEGNQLVVVEMTIYNTSTYSMPMFDNDFQIQWGDGDEDYGFPIAGSMCTDYEIAINDTVSGDLVFEVPADTKDYSIAFQEYYEDNTEGDTYFIYFTVTAGDGVITA